MKKGILQVIFVALAVFILDQITKAWAASTFKTVPIDDWFGFTYSENHGIAFGIPVSGNLLLAITAVLIVVLIGFAIKKLPLSKGIYQLTVGLVVFSIEFGLDRCVISFKSEHGPRSMWRTWPLWEACWGWCGYCVDVLKRGIVKY